MSRSRWNQRTEPLPRSRFLEQGAQPDPVLPGGLAWSLFSARKYPVEIRLTHRRAKDHQVLGRIAH